MRHFKEMNGCMLGFSGSFCEYPVDHCVSQPCQNEGVCHNVMEQQQQQQQQQQPPFLPQLPAYTPASLGAAVSFRCDCDAGYEGDTCQVEADPCRPVGGAGGGESTCLNGATCVDLGQGERECVCRDGFRGDRSKYNCRNKFKRRTQL